jgi:hypothetical protein
MKRLRIILLVATLVVVAALAVIALAASSVPNTVHIQGLLTDDTGEPVANETVHMTFLLYDREVGGMPGWQESQAITTDASGLWNAQLGALTKLTHSLFADSSRWLAIVVGAKDTLSRVQFTSAPFSYRLSTVDGADAGTLTGNLDVTGGLEVMGQLAPLGGIVTASGITIQSTGSNVLVIAGASQITVDPSGGVTIQSSSVTINSTGNLNISADSTLSLDADAVEIQAQRYVSAAADLVLATAQDSIVLQSAESAETARIQTGMEFTVDAGDDVLVHSDRLVAIDAGTDMAFTSGQDVRVDASDSLVLVANNAVWLEAGSGFGLRAGTDMQLEAGVSMSLNAQTTLDLESTTSLTLDAVNVTATAGGIMDINGTQVQIN